MKRIVVGIDFSEGSDLALEHALGLARFHGGEIVLAHVGDEPHHGPSRGEISEVLQEIADEARHKSEAALDRLAAPLAGSGIAVSQRMLGGFPDTALCELADELSADLLVVGTHGFSGFKRVLLGSVAERVVRLAKVPVLVVRAAPPAGGYANILVPTDFTRRSELALERACAMVAPAGCIELLHCWQMPAGYNGATNPVDERYPDLHSSIAAGVQGEGKRLTDKYKERTSAEIVFAATEASPVRGIQERAAAGNWDLIVMGSHGRRGFRRFLLGSVAEATVRHVDTSVLVMHDAPDDS